MWSRIRPQLQRAAEHLCQRPSPPSAGTPVAAGGALWQQVRYGPKDGRPGRNEHHRFGAVQGRGRFYYRFHKIIGKWNWRGYQERYIAPRALENRQRWIPTTHADYRVMRRSKDWYWRLPKALALATTSEEVLEAWVRFRHKQPKRTYHFFKVLGRLTEVGGCDPSDWRLRLITSRLCPVHRKVLNLPRLAKFYAQLRATRELEHLARFAYKMLPRYPPEQLALIAQAFGQARLQDKRLFCDVARFAEPELGSVSPANLVHLAQAFASIEICHYTFLTQLSAQAQLRVQQASEGKAPPGSCPTFAQLSELALAFARLKLQDYSYFEMCASQAASLLQEGLPGPTPPALAALCTACSRLKIHEVRLFEAVLAHVSQHWYDYPAAALAELGAAIAPVLPMEPEPVQEVYRQMLEVIASERELLTLHSLALAVRFVAELDEPTREFIPGLWGQLADRLLELRDESRERYDLARVAEAFSQRCPNNDALFSALCRHLHRHLGIFEPVDFVRFLRSLAAVSYRDERVVHALAKWVRKRSAEFSAFDWQGLLTSFAALGRIGGQRARQLRPLGRPLPSIAA